MLGYTVGLYPPGMKDEFVRHFAVNEAMVRAHRLAVDALRSGPGSFPVGITLSMEELVAGEGGESDARTPPSRSSRTPSSTAPPATTSSACSATSALLSAPTGPARDDPGGRR